MLLSPAAHEAVNRIKERGPSLFINGEWTAPYDGETSETTDPSTGRMIAEFALAGAYDVDAAVCAATSAQPRWAALTTAERGESFAQLASLIERYGETIRFLDALDAGLPVRRMSIDINGALRALRGWPGLASSLRGEVLPAKGKLHYTSYAPYGVVCKIAAYNHPFLFAVKGTLAALISGNAIVLKPADQTPLSSLFLGDLISKSFPPGVFNIVTGFGETGKMLTTHPLIRRIAFTGSAPTAAAIQAGAAADGIIRTVSLELGGKNAMIVNEDVDVPSSAREVVRAMNLRANQGQSCGSTSRVFVHRRIYQNFLDALKDVFADLTLGPACDLDSDMGPLISAEHKARVDGMVQRAKEEGGSIHTGGPNDPRIPDEGYFVAPTVITDLSVSAQAAQQEIFGPVVCVFPWEDEEKMLQQVNGVDYGLTASVWTNQISTALRQADLVQAGYVWINDSTTHYWGTPFGGWKNSGIGREESMSELFSYLQTKSVHVALTS